MDRNNTVTIEIDGNRYQAPMGAMLIEVADANGINIPRFCYHKKLSVAANCRMCLVEVERAPKPLPACATPVHDGMKVWTRSPMAIDAQKGTMEFLLINHPLDCPICDQGGECELQDISLGFGGDISRFTEQKRVVPDPDLGPLVATNMTRCIQCTRCVRFGEEIASIRDLGATGRGENMRIGTYVEHVMESELSGNVIDLCPVGALTSKPSRFSARAWEMIAHSGIAPHDCLGSNIEGHSAKKQLVRIVPRENESINETWLSDRDRYGYLGQAAPDRVLAPKIKTNGQWQNVEWNVALTKVAEILREYDPADVGGLVSSNATLEEQYLFQKLLRAIGVANIDHRIRQVDFSGDQDDPLFPWLGQSIAEIEENKAILLVGSNIRKDQPLMGLRIRKAGWNDAKLMDVNPVAFDHLMPVSDRVTISPRYWTQVLATILVAVYELTSENPPEWLTAMQGDDLPVDQIRKIANTLFQAEKATILFGPMAIYHPEYAMLRYFGSEIARKTNSVFGYLPEGSNSAGACVAGALPHRLPGGRPSNHADAFNAREMFEKNLPAFVLYGFEPEFDCTDAIEVLKSLNTAKHVISFNAFANDFVLDYADVILPLALPYEMFGTFINVEGNWQSFNGMIPPPGDARPGWKVLRVLGVMMGLDDFEYLSPEAIRDEVKNELDLTEGFNNTITGRPSVQKIENTSDYGFYQIASFGVYASDPIVRRSDPLRATPENQGDAIFMNRSDAEQIGIKTGDKVTLKRNDTDIRKTVIVSDQVAQGTLWGEIGHLRSMVTGIKQGMIEVDALEGVNR